MTQVLHKSISIKKLVQLFRKQCQFPNKNISYTHQTICQSSKRRPRRRDVTLKLLGRSYKEKKTEAAVDGIE